MKVVISIILTAVVTSGWWFVAIVVPVFPKDHAFLAFWGIVVLILLTFINIIIFVIEAINEWNK